MNLTPELEASMRRGWKLLREQSGWGDNVGLLFAEIDSLRAQLAASRAESEQQLWECPDCGFQMHVKHHDASRDDDCPACAELALRARVAALVAGLEPFAAIAKSPKWMTANANPFPASIQPCELSDCHRAAALLATTPKTVAPDQEPQA